MCSSLCFLSPGSIFGFSGEDADDVLYVNWLSMVRAGLVGLEYFTPESNKWRQVSFTVDVIVSKDCDKFNSFWNCTTNTMYAAILWGETFTDLGF